MINNNLTKAMKDTIQQLGLIDTGALYNSIKVDVSVRDNNLYLNVIGEEYIKYLKDKNPITNTFVKQSIYALEINKIYSEILSRIITEGVTRRTKINFEPQIVLTYNGV
jgi:hypothetical protein